MDIPENEQDALLDLLRQLKASDLSILQATLETPDSQIATVRNSANDVLWSRFVALGLAVEMALDVTLPPALAHVQPRSFALTGPGRAVVAALLQRL